MAGNDNAEAKKIALEAINRVHAKGITIKELTAMYDKWADTYDKEISPEVYKGPIYVAEALAELYDGSSKPRRWEAKILDIAAGTGRIGIHLFELGFRQIDALDPSEKMLEKLRRLGIYGITWRDTIGIHQTEIPDGAYDATVSSGAFGGGHMPVKAIHEMVRIVRPGGFIVNIIREEYLTTTEEYSKMEALYKELQDNQKLIQVSRKVVPQYSLDNNGVVFVHKVL
ncbi:methyltransferase-like protein 27 [Ischnura elegans]|uniref:methyltransferase-like protein 27 n=1 Tax=Ischnura elegans TaxID=197161 RepID=UPI001ED87740|nr:methyltransferase-like protein 27 [Ischnura elegans]XP_046385477.1 methyltransferase-like protein 27 [Ischnura elegans]